MRFVCLLLLGSLLVASCSDPQFTASPEVGPDPDLELLSQDLQRYVNAVCEFEARCGIDELDRCVDWFLGEVCGGKFGSLELPKLDECVSGIAGLGCTASAHELPACLPIRNALHQARPGSGRIAGEGQACSESVVSASYCDLGLFCDAEPGQCGLCQKKLAVGNSCRVDGSGECSYHAYCSDAGVCTALEAKGGPCAYDFQCDEALSCVSGTCQHADDLIGRACASETDCGSRLPCREGRCQALKPVGEPCKEDFECQTESCFEGTCTAEARCQRGEPGMRCAWDEQCKMGLVCDWMTSRCTEALADGERGCLDDGKLPPPLPCVTGSHCTRVSDGAGRENFACAKGVPNGGACTPAELSFECVSQYCSPQAKCAVRPPLVCE
jgi:hypothetical protein